MGVTHAISITFDSWGSSANFGGERLFTHIVCFIQKRKNANPFIEIMNKNFVISIIFLYNKIKLFAIILFVCQN